jgi:hypothetical protein
VQLYKIKFKPANSPNSLQFPFCALGFVMVPIFVKLPAPKSSFVSKLARVDWIGGFLFIGGTTSFLIGLSWAGVQFEWSSAQSLAPMFVGLNAVIAAIAWEIFGAKEPFLRPQLFSSASAIAAYACAFGQGFLVSSDLAMCYCGPTTNIDRLAILRTLLHTILLHCRSVPRADTIWTGLAPSDLSPPTRKHCRLLSHHEIRALPLGRVERLDYHGHR